MTSTLDSADAARKPVLIIVHQEHSTPGRVGALLEAQGHALDIRRPRFGDPLPETLAHHAGAVIFGGPMSANDRDAYIKAEIDWMAVPLAEQKPLLGICLGAQMLARHLGAPVAPHPENLTEIGYYPLEPTDEGIAMAKLLEAPWPGHVYHWHNEGFGLAHGAAHLAGSTAYPNQAFRYGPAAFGLQFHPEVTRAIIARWTSMAAHKLTLPGAQNREDHFRGCDAHDGTIAVWADNFLKYWLKTGRDA